MSKIKLHFNAHYHTVKELQGMQDKLKMLIRRRRLLSEMIIAREITTERAVNEFIRMFDNLTSDYEV